MALGNLVHANHRQLAQPGLASPAKRILGGSYQTTVSDRETELCLGAEKEKGRGEEQQ